MVEIHRETPMELFRELVEGAMTNQQVESSAESTFYLVQLLDAFVRPDRLYAAVGATPEEPLAGILCRAVASEGARKIALLKFTGDLSLFLGGFLSDSFERQILDVDYYVRMGGYAYGEMSEMRVSRAAAELFAELAANFVRFVDVLHEVSESFQLTDPTDLLRLYEKWLRTGSDRTAELLRQQGILPVPVTLTVQ